MNKKPTDRWQALDPGVRKALVERDYSAPSLGQRIAEAGIEAGQLAGADRSDPAMAQAWIPGVEVFARTIHPQRHRGVFGEFVRRDEGPLAKIGLWPQQWADRPDVCPDREGFSYSPAERTGGNFA